MADRVCVDASLALMLLLPHELTERAEGLWWQWAEEGVGLVAPPLFFAEVTSVVRALVYHRRITSEDGEQAFDDFLSMDVKAAEYPGLQRDAWALAKQYNRPRAYDAQYLAVAKTLGCDLWTGDRRLVRAVNEPWVRWAGDI